MPFTLDDLERISARMGTGTKTLRQMSDTQFTAWLRAQGASGQIGVVNVAPGQLMIPIEERVRVLNDLEREGFYIPEVMGTAPAEGGVDADLVARLAEHADGAAQHLQEIQSIVAQLGEIDPRVNLRATVYGAVELVDLIRGATQHARRGSTSGG